MMTVNKQCLTNHDEEWTDGKMANKQATDAEVTASTINLCPYL